MPQTAITLVHVSKFFGAKPTEMKDLSPEDKTELKALLAVEVEAGRHTL